MSGATAPSDPVRRPGGGARLAEEAGGAVGAVRVAMAVLMAAAEGGVPGKLRLCHRRRWG